MDIDLVRAVGHGKEHEWAAPKRWSDLTAERVGGIVTRNQGEGRVTPPPADIQITVHANGSRTTIITALDGTQKMVHASAPRPGERQQVSMTNLSVLLDQGECA